MNTPVAIPTPEEFIEQAAVTKSQLIEKLAAQMLAKGYELAQASWRYYTAEAHKKAGPQMEGEFTEARAERARLDWEYDALKHAVSALQSTLKFERELDRQ